MMVARRVITPLHTMRDAMLQGGRPATSHVDTGYAARQDEIGALAGALETFKQQAIDKGADRGAGAPTQCRRHGAAAGDRTPCRRVREHGAPDAEPPRRALPARCGPPRPACRRSRARPMPASRIAEKASGEASMNVQTVAAASEQLSASINDISRQAAHAAGIASRAVSRGA